jgi:O-methyltransferase domain/Dimerisation domain
MTTARQSAISFEPASVEHQPVVTHDRIIQLAMGFWASKVLLSAVELGIFGALNDGPLELRALRTRTGLHARAAHDFFDALVALGLLQRDDSGRYSNTAETDLYLNPARVGYIGGIVEMFNARLYGFWGSLTEALRTGEPQNEAKRGGDLFANLYTDPARLEGFMRAMTGMSLPVAQALSRAFPWENIHTVVDVGTAQGCVPVQLALAHPHLTGGGFDLPAVGPIFSRFVASHGLADRLQFFPGDFLAGELPRADVLVMGLILHDWDLPTKCLLLEKAYAALEKGGSLIVYELLIDDERRLHLPGLLMSLNMLIETRGGFDYTAADCIGWMNAAGFSATRVLPLAGPHRAVIATK